MADENVVEIKVQASGVQQTVSDMQQASGAVKGLGGESEKGFEKGRLGAVGFHAAAHDLLGQLGLHGPMMRMLSSDTAMYAESLGGAATGIGIFILAVAGAVKIYEHFAEAEKKKREELDKSTQSLEGEIKALFANKLETEDVKKANQDLLDVKLKIYKEDQAAKIKAETDELKKLREEVEKGVGFWEKWWIQEKAAFQGKDLEKETAAAVDEHNRKLNNQIALKEKGLILDQKKLQATRESEREEIALMYQRRQQAERGLAEYQKEIVTAQNKHVASERKTNLAILNSTRDMLAQRTKDYQKNAADEAKLEEQRMQYKMSILSEGSSILDQIYTLSHNRMKVFFYASRAAAAAEAVIQGHLAAMKAVGQGGIWGLPFSGIFEAMGVIKAALIMAQTFEGGGGGGGGGSAAVPTFAANPVTGLPASNGPQTNTQPQQSVVVNFYGTVASDQELARKLVQAQWQAQQDNAVPA